ncbi:hypothetical protein M2H39_20840 [Vibrio vulnificus]|nr:hypothetical protein [Vibrio vulnificus]MCU8111649.1 hypothetical protein [Vibrio vulnificus]
MEPEVLVGSGIAVLVAKEVIPKLLGPSASYVGESARNLLARCDVNLNAIFSRAVVKLGDRLEEEGGVNPRVLKHLINEGAYCEGKLAREYYAGLLASAKSKNLQDDRALTYLYLVNELSSYQILMHHIAYRLFSKLFAGTKLNLALATNRQQLRFVLPLEIFIECADLKSDNADSVISHCISGLCRHNLFESTELLSSVSTVQPRKELVITPTVFGSELLLWSEGIPEPMGQDLLDKNLKLPESVVSFCGEATKYSDRRYI